MAAPARFGARNPASTAWWWCAINRSAVSVQPDAILWQNAAMYDSIYDSMHDSTASRRGVLRLLAGAAALAAVRPARAGETRIEKLMAEGRAHGTVSQRIDYISAALRGTRYRGDTLIGGPKKPEVFVTRDDGFDCVTYCETVLAAARARTMDEFATALREIRYHNGVLDWRERNHYFFEWGQHNVENKMCKAVAPDGAVDIEKSVDSQAGLTPRRFTMRVIPRAVFEANKDLLESGDVVGFVSHRPNLDYFHVGFIVFGPGRVMLLRNASETRGRVVDEDMGGFLARYGVRYVSVLRAQEPATV
jgi:hypothetical protein